MSIDVETMFYVREAPWHGLGVNVAAALNSSDALVAAGLDWSVTKEKLMTVKGAPVLNAYATVRSSDQATLGIVTDRYKILQNKDAFKFTDELLGGDIVYETAGSLQGGRKVWMLAKLSKEYSMLGDEVTPYLVLSNSHDGSAPVRVAMTPVRVVCQNTLNFALKTASRSWSIRHTSNIQYSLNSARETLGLATKYMEYLEKEMLKFNHLKIDDIKLRKLINRLIPQEDNISDKQLGNIKKIKADILLRYEKAPDLKNLDKSGYRFINAIADHVTHCEPLRITRSYKENLFIKTIEGSKLLDKAFDMLSEVA